MNQQALMKKIKKMQQEMQDAQAEIEETVFSATAGGVVTVEYYGTKEVKDIKIDPSFECTSPDDLEMLSDMIVAASKEAYKKIDQTTEEKMAKYNNLASGFGGLF